MNLESLLVRYTGLCKETITVSDEIGGYVCKLIRPVIHDITYSVGLEVEAAGVDIISFYSESHGKEEFNEFCYTLENILPELKSKTYTPYGFYLTYEEVLKIQTIFKDDKNKKDNIL